MKLTLSLLASRSSEGLLLKEKLTSLAESTGFCVKIINSVEPYEYMKTCFNDDIVIVDATIEPGNQHNYDVIMPFPVE